MAILFAGTSVSDFDHAVYAIRRARATAPSPSAFSINMDEGVEIPANLGTLVKRFSEPSSSYWVSLHWGSGANTTTTSRASELVLGVPSPTSYLVDSNLIVRVRRSGGSTIIVSILANDSTVATVTVPGPSGVEAIRYDIRVYVHPTNGRVEVYSDGAPILLYEGNTERGIPEHSALLLRSAAVSYVSEILVATTDTRTLTMRQMRINGPGSFQEWEGPWTNLSGIIPTELSVASNTPDARATYSWAKPATPLGYRIAGIVFTAFAKVNGPVVDEIEPVYYDGFGMYALEPFSGHQNIYSGGQSISELDPATGLRFTDAKFAAMQLGFRTKGI
jgi:hypothetical protein